MRFRLRTLLILVAVTGVGMLFARNKYRTRDVPYALVAVSELGILPSEFDRHLETQLEFLSSRALASQIYNETDLKRVLQNYHDPIGYLQQRVRVKRLGKSTIVRISFDCWNRDLAARAAEAIVRGWQRRSPGTAHVGLWHLCPEASRSAPLTYNGATPPSAYAGASKSDMQRFVNQRNWANRPKPFFLCDEHGEHAASMVCCDLEEDINAGRAIRSAVRIDAEHAGQLVWSVYLCPRCDAEQRSCESREPANEDGIDRLFEIEQAPVCHGCFDDLRVPDFGLPTD